MNKIFITEDNNFKIIINDNKPILFNSYINKIYTFNFYNNIDHLIYKLNLTDIDLERILDNLYFHIETKQDTSIYISCKDTTCISNILQISNKQISIPYTINIPFFELYSFN